MVNDRIGALKAALNDSYESNNDIMINVEEKEAFMPDFFSEVEEITLSLDKIVATVSEVKRLHSAILSAPSTNERTKEEMESLMDEIKRLSTRVKQKLKFMAEDIEVEEETKKPSAQLRIKKMQHPALSRRFVESMMEYNNVQTEYRQRCKERIKRQLEITGNVKTDDEIEEMLESGNFAVFTQGIIVETQQAKQSLADIEARHAEIMRLEKTIRDLHTMFLDMAVLVESQGELIDRIEYNVQNAGEFVDTANKGIVHAIKYQSKSRKKLIILCIVVAIILVIILGIIIGTVTK